MGFIPDSIKETTKNMGNSFIKAGEFEGDGLVLQCVTVEKIKSSNPKFGANEKDYLYKEEVLEEGETFRYVFRNASGDERVYTSKSAATFIAFDKAELESKDWVRITKKGQGDNTRYTVEKVEAPAPVPIGHRGMKGVEYPEPDINVYDMPF